MAGKRSSGRTVQPRLSAEVLEELRGEWELFRRNGPCWVVEGHRVCVKPRGHGGGHGWVLCVPSRYKGGDEG